MEKIGFIITLTFIFVMMAGCGKSNGNGKIGNTLEVVIYYESVDVTECKEELHNWFGEKYEILSEEYKTDEEQYNDYKNNYDLDGNMFNPETGKMVICTILIGNIKDQNEADKIKQDISEIKNVGLVKIAYPYAKQDTVIISTEESKETEKHRDEVMVSFYYQAENAEQCENGIVAYIKDNYSVEGVGYTNFTDDMNKYKEENPDEIVVVPKNNLFICNMRINNIKSEAEIKTLVAEIEKDEKASQVNYIYPTYD